MGMFARLREWWRRPATARDRIRGAFIGTMGFFWLGVAARILLGPMPVSFTTLGWWAASTAMTGLILGVLFPKTITAALFPFAILGIGGD